MLEGQKQEKFFHWPHRNFVSPLEGMPCRLQRQGVRFEGSTGAAKHIARELVQRKDSREAVCRPRKPIAARTGCDLRVKRAEILRNLRIEYCVLVEPPLQPCAAFMRLAKPEAQHACGVGVEGGQPSELALDLAQ